MSDSNIFETIDRAMSQLNITKKMFLIMIVSVIILPPAMMFGTNMIGEYMKDEGEARESPRIAKLVALVDKLESEELTVQEYIDETRYVKTAKMYGGPGTGYYISLLQKMIYVFWIGYGSEPHDVRLEHCLLFSALPSNFLL